MRFMDWVEEGSDNSVLHAVELPFRWIAVLLVMNTVIFAAFGAVAAAVVALRALS